jgi:hypothetical protein
MVKFLSLMTYLGFVWALVVSLCVAPGESFGQTTTQYSRVVAQAERIAYLAAQRSALASQVATAALAPSATSLAVRMIAGPVGWAALGVSAGLVLAQMYYSQPDLAAIKTAASPPTGTYTYTYNGQTYTIPTNQFAGSPAATSNCPGGQMYGFPEVPPPGMTPAGPGNWWCPPAPAQPGLGTPTQEGVQQYLLDQAPTAPHSIEQHTHPVGTTGTTQPADNTVSQPVSPTEMPTTVKPKPVPAGDIIVVDSVAPPASTPQQNTQQQTTTTTTTTTQNPDGSTTKQEETEATTSCRTGTHENRTFGTVLQAHQTIWATSGLLSTLNLLKSLTWPSTLPVIALPSALFGNQQVDFNQWAWFFTVLRTLVIAIASFAAYRIIFVGGGQTT